jgi:hypothetical protein
VLAACCSSQLALVHLAPRQSRWARLWGHSHEHQYMAVHDCSWRIYRCAGAAGRRSNHSSPTCLRGLSNVAGLQRRLVRSVPCDGRACFADAPHPCKPPIGQRQREACRLGVRFETNCCSNHPTRDCLACCVEMAMRQVHIDSGCRSHMQALVTASARGARHPIPDASLRTAIAAVGCAL